MCFLCFVLFGLRIVWVGSWLEIGTSTVEKTICGDSKMVKLKKEFFLLFHFQTILKNILNIFIVVFIFGGSVGFLLMVVHYPLDVMVKVAKLGNIFPVVLCNESKKENVKKDTFSLGFAMISCLSFTFSCSRPYQ